MTDVQLDTQDILNINYADSELANTGGLMPTFRPKYNKGPIQGFLLGVSQMPDVKTKKGPREWQAVSVLLTAACEVTKGTGDNADPYVAEKGEVILVPLGGSLGNNQEMQRLACDPMRAYWAKISLLGAKDIGAESPMWDYEVKVQKDRPLIRSVNAALALAPASFRAEDRGDRQLSA